MKVHQQRFFCTSMNCFMRLSHFPINYLLKQVLTYIKEGVGHLTSREMFVFRSLWIFRDQWLSGRERRRRWRAVSGEFIPGTYTSYPAPDLAGLRVLALSLTMLSSGSLSLCSWSYLSLRSQLKYHSIKCSFMYM